MEKKEPVSKVKYDSQGRYIFLRLSLGGLHEAVGILEDVKADVLSLIRGPRMIRAQQAQLKKEALRGGTGVVNGLKKNPKIIK